MHTKLSPANKERRDKVKSLSAKGYWKSPKGCREKGPRIPERGPRNISENNEKEEFRKLVKSRNGNTY